MNSLASWIPVLDTDHQDLLEGSCLSWPSVLETNHIFALYCSCILSAHQMFLRHFRRLPDRGRTQKFLQWVLSQGRSIAWVRRKDHESIHRHITTLANCRQTCNWAVAADACMLWDKSVNQSSAEVHYQVTDWRILAYLTWVPAFAKWSRVQGYTDGLSSFRRFYSIEQTKKKLRSCEKDALW